MRQRQNFRPSECRPLTSLLTAVCLLLISPAITAQSPQPPQPERIAEYLAAKRQVLTEFRSHRATDPSNRMMKLGQELEILNREFKQYRARGGLTRLGQPFRPGNRMLRVKDDYVIVDVIARHEPEQLRADLELLDMRNTSVFGRHVSGQLPIERLDQLAGLPSMRQVRPAYARVRTGGVTSQGDIALRADDGRLSFGVDGTGVMVGSLSDSFDCLNGAAGNVISDDLPAGIVVLAEEIGCISGRDEGRAMMQIIHDLAPGSMQAFHSAFNGIADFANGILELQSIAGAGIITDDVFYFAEPFFQDGPIAQAIDTVRSQGVAYFSAAGNDADNAYSAAFVNSGQGGFRAGSVAHDFDPGPATDTRQNLTIPAGGEVFFILQWDQPFFSVSGAPGSASDLDIVLYPQNPGPALAGSLANNLGGDALEIFSYTNNSGSARTVRLGIDLVSGPAPERMMYQYLGDVVIDEYATYSPTITGHANAAGGLAVGAVRYDATPAYGTIPPIREYFSSIGGVPILFDTDGTAIFDERQKPEIMAADGGDNTFFGQDYEGNGTPNFFGTSAAAPHAAGVAALLKEIDPVATPERIYGALQATAIDMDAPGVDNTSGYGLIDTGEALEALTSLTLSITYNPPPAKLSEFFFWGGLSASGGVPPYTYSAIGGFLQFSLELRADSGWILGIPQEFAGTTNHTVQVTDSIGGTASIQFQITTEEAGDVCGTCHQDSP